MPELTPQDWETAHRFRGKTLRVHRVDLNDPTTIPAFTHQLRPIGVFRAHPALDVKLKGQDGRFLPLDGILVFILGPEKAGDQP